MHLLLTAVLGTAVAGTLTVEIIDVGQGDGILITSPAGKTVLIDGGTGRSTNMARELTGRGLEKIDLVMGSHNHADHIGGLDEVLAAIPVSIYLDQGMPHTTETYTKVMDLVESRGIAYKVARKGQTFTLDDGIRIELLAPRDPLLSGTRSDLNSNSIVARLTHGENCFLFTGDSELDTEQRLMEEGLAPCDVLKVAHHGSAHSTSRRFLEMVQPTWAVVSVGEGNRYKHPSPDTMDRVRRAGAQVIRTDRSGTIRLLSDGKTIRAVVESWPAPVVPEGISVAPQHFVSDDHLATAPPPPPPATAPIVAPAPTITVTETPPATTVEATPPPPLVAAAPSKVKRKQRRWRRRRRATPTPVVAAPPTPAPPPPAPVSSKADINAATMADLVAVSGIGPAKATAILQYLESHRPIATIDVLDDVPGIGPATLEGLRRQFEVRPTTGALP